MAYYNANKTSKLRRCFEYRMKAEEVKSAPSSDAYDEESQMHVQERKSKSQGSSFSISWNFGADKTGGKKPLFLDIF